MTSIRTFIILLFLLPTCVQALDVTVVTEEWPPYNYEEDGQVRGVVTEIVRAVLDRAGLGYDIQIYPWARAYKMAMEGENVLIYSIFRLPSRNHLFKWIPVKGFAIEMSLFKPAFRDDLQVHDLEEVKQYMVGVTRETSTHHFLLENGFVEGKNVLPLSSEMQNIFMTMPGVERTDFATGDSLSLARWLQVSAMPPDYLEKVLPLFREEIYLAFSLKTSDAMVERIHAAMDSITEDGTVSDIIRSQYELFNSTMQE